MNSVEDEGPREGQGRRRREANGVKHTLFVCSSFVRLPNPHSLSACGLMYGGWREHKGWQQEVQARDMDPSAQRPRMTACSAL